LLLIALNNTILVAHPIAYPRKKKRERLPVPPWILYELLTKVSLQQAFQTAAVASLVAKTLENAVKTGIFNRLAQK